MNLLLLLIFWWALCVGISVQFSINTDTHTGEQDKKNVPTHTSSSTSTTFAVNEDVTTNTVAFSKPNNGIEDLKHFPQYILNNCTGIELASVLPSKYELTHNGFVATVVRSYANHHNLIIRPDDVWIGILTQFSFYLNKHAETFRNKFVNFEGKKKLTVLVNPGDNIEIVVKKMTDKIQQNIIDPDIKDWSIPSFTTTTETDIMTGGVVLLAQMKKYFHYEAKFSCGIPFVTLEGSVEDWVDIQQRLVKLREYNLEKWYVLLDRILTEFVKAKRGIINKTFWKNMVIYDRNRKTGGVCGTPVKTFLSGWITAFAVFNEDGDWKDVPNYIFDADTETFKLDNSPWPTIHYEDIPTGIVNVDFHVKRDLSSSNYTFIAGHLATEIKQDNVTLQPVLGWSLLAK